jgi:MerR family mercuric resistance operon transcriptional regulator
MTISRLAAAAGVHVETVRYYQRRGLLPEPERPMGSVRRYGPDDVGRLQFIRRAQAMGFSLDEIAGLLEVKGQRACEETRRPDRTEIGRGAAAARMSYDNWKSILSTWWRSVATW